MNTRRADLAAPLTQARRVVVKVGSALLVDGETGRVNRAWLETLVEDLLRLRKPGQRVILVASGAIALGPGLLGPEERTVGPHRARACLQGAARGVRRGGAAGAAPSGGQRAPPPLPERARHPRSAA